MNFGEKLKIIRSNLGLTQQELADRLNTSKQTISRYENSEREPNLRTVQEFSSKLGIDMVLFSDDTIVLLTPEHIKHQRTSLELSFEELSEFTGISVDRLVSFENGEIFPTSLELCALSDFFKCDADYLLGRSWMAVDDTSPFASCADALVDLRNKAGLTQAELSKQTKLTRSSISMYETGRREPDLATLKLLADFYHVDMNTITGTSVSPKLSDRRNRLIQFILTTDDKMIDLFWDIAERVNPSENK